MNWYVIRSRWFSFKVERRVPLALFILLIALIAAIALNLSIGTFQIPLRDVITTLLRPAEASEYQFVIHTLRLPRTVLAILIGMSLAVSGTILQGLTGNNLAAPEIVGVTSGASVTVVAAIIAFPQIPVTLYPPAAIIGGFLAAAAVYVLAWRNGITPLRLILVGIAVNAVAEAFSSLLISIGEMHTVIAAFSWLAGSVNDASWRQISAISPWLIVLIPTTWLCARQLNLFNMNSDMAASLGVRVEAVRLLLIAASVALAAVAISVAGTVGFVGLMAPHIARRLLGPTHEGLIPGAAIIGGLIVLAADVIGRNLFAPIQIPVGIVTAIIGVPYFLYLFYRHRDQW